MMPKQIYDALFFVAKIVICLVSEIKPADWYKAVLWRGTLWGMYGSSHQVSYLNVIFVTLPVFKNRASFKSLKVAIKVALKFAAPGIRSF
jgi:hypothetical protein